MGYYWRSPKTTNERRANAGSPVPVRGRRKNVPDSYDDLSRSWWPKSWKKYRKEQYKAKEKPPERSKLWGPLCGGDEVRDHHEPEIISLLR